VVLLRNWVGLSLVWRLRNRFSGRRLHHLNGSVPAAGNFFHIRGVIADFIETEAA